MLRMKTLLLLLAFFAWSSDAWFWSKDPEPTTSTSIESAPSGTTGATNATQKNLEEEEEEDDDNLSGVGDEILNVATGIRKFVAAWDVTPTPGTTNGGPTQKVESANPNTTGNANGVGGERVEEEGVGVESVSNGDEMVSKINETFSGVLDLPPHDSRFNACLPVPSDWPICSGKRPESFTLPNFFNHTSVEEVGAVLQEWAWLTKLGCHHGAEWFLCLLLAPPCTPPPHPHLPCRSFCQVLQDSCWASLEDGRLPVECHLLPDGGQEPGGPACASVSNLKEESGVSLLQLIGDPPPHEIPRVTGPRGEPGFIFNRASVSGQPALAHIPNPFHRHFSLVFHIKPTSPGASVLFSITDGPQKIMYVGVKLSAVQNGRQRVQFFYTEPGSEASYEAASFEVPSMVETWSRFSLSVFDEQVTFYQGCDSEPQVVKFERSPDPMELDAGAGIFVGQAGGGRR
ncbi:hypothetical protein CgunFtcFv8_018755 [Champsocephalus gunnari]|uniref:FZ domain-containing protein n=1 Tax=Champsocephalus gunnari TaxID=52237 RepID=A0AAN8BWN5_CHAGU|nr:hypothetical protein CgunFtcFv8_018755 [Champsocephalus gunnari]